MDGPREEVIRALQKGGGTQSTGNAQQPAEQSSQASQQDTAVKRVQVG